MARRATRYAPRVASADINPISWSADATMYLVHETIYAVGQFNPSPRGNAGLNLLGLPQCFI
jgi:hypothetical protein